MNQNLNRLAIIGSLRKTIVIEILTFTLKNKKNSLILTFFLRHKRWLQIFLPVVYLETLCAYML